MSEKYYLRNTVESLILVVNELKEKCADGFEIYTGILSSIESRLEALEKKPVAEPKKMQKFIPVSSCNDCFFSGARVNKKENGIIEYFCKKTKRTIYWNNFNKLFKVFPVWCPLGETEIK